MPITNGHGNPNWSRDESLLALDLLYSHGKPISENHPDVLDLSSVLRRAKFHPEEKRQESFRNPAGVALKLQNLFSAVEPGRGLTYSKTDLEVVTDFPRSRAATLARLAQSIRASIEADEPDELPVEDDTVFVEGRLLTRVHQSRERAPGVRRALMKRHEALQCVVCEFRPPEIERALQESFFEAHHIVPLANLVGTTKTRQADIALLCANCHRFIHKLIASSRRWVGVEEARELRRAKAQP